MTTHPAIDRVIDRIVRDVIGGAVDTAKEVMDALGEVVSDSEANTPAKLFEELDQAAIAVMRICPSFAPPINVLHQMLGTLEKDLDNGCALELAKTHLKETQSFFHKTVDTALSKLAGFGAELIHEGDTVFMFSMSSTTWKVLRKARDQNKNFKVLVTEARSGQ